MNRSTFRDFSVGGF